MQQPSSYSTGMHTYVQYVHTLFASILSSHTTGSPLPSVNTGVIVAVTVVNITILLLTVGMLVITITLIIKRRRQPSTVTWRCKKESRGTVQIYDEVDDSIGLKRSNADAKVYQDIDVSRMDHSNQYTSMK